MQAIINSLMQKNNYQKILLWCIYSNIALIIYIFLLLFSSSCMPHKPIYRSDIDVVIKNKELVPYWNHFKIDVMQKYKLPYTLEQLTIEMGSLDGNRAGACQIEYYNTFAPHRISNPFQMVLKGRIIIDRAKWNHHGYEWRNTLMIHELAHCLLHYKYHSDNIPFIKTYIEEIPLDQNYSKKLKMLVKNSCLYNNTCDWTGFNSSAHTH